MKHKPFLMLRGDPSSSVTPIDKTKSGAHFIIASCSSDAMMLRLI
jgi:hypothetical protein